MTRRLKDYLTIGAALLAILLCGYSVGFLLGEKKGYQRASSANSELTPPKESIQKDLWIERTLSKFDQDLDLSPEQKKAISLEIKKTYDGIRKSRAEALQQYSQQVINLHSEILPLLSESQQEKVKEQQHKLSESLD